MLPGNLYLADEVYLLGRVKYTEKTMTFIG